MKNYSKTAALPIRFRPLAIIVIIIAFFDELAFGVLDSAWPLLRTELGLSYVHIGVLIGVPFFFSSFMEPLLGVLGDSRKRRWIILCGGGAFALAMLLLGSALSFWMLLLAMVLGTTASGAFVSLSQATYVDINPGRSEQAMARWTLAGSLGVTLGPFLLALAVFIGGGWRAPILTVAAAALLLTLLISRQPFPSQSMEEEPSLAKGVGGLGRAFQDKEVRRWFVLLIFSDFMLDILLGFLAVYAVDAAGIAPSQAWIAVAVWSAAGVLSDALIIPVLERISGIRYLRWSAPVMLALYAAFLLAPNPWIKIGLLIPIGFCNAGWYAILQAKVYTSLPDQSGTAMAVSSIAATVLGGFAILLGYIAETAGIQMAMWLLAAGPVALILGLPRGGGDLPLAPEEPAVQTG